MNPFKLFAFVPSFVLSLFYGAVLLFLGLSPNVLSAQTQTVKGLVTDAESGFPLIGVTVLWVQPDQEIGAVTDVDGYFELSNIPVGRQSFVCSYLGYKPTGVTNILISAGKETYLELQMEESVTNLETVTVTDKRSGQPVNDMVLLGAKTLRVEEVIRYSGTFGDVSRMAQNFAGVSGATDDRNDIIVRGNSPSAVLWRIEGIDVPS
ncbi:MAG: carboxypeptidase-like regulatory domain-containing protein, partial [Bacteroidota bacterium]